MIVWNCYGVPCCFIWPSLSLSTYLHWSSCGLGLPQLWSFMAFFSMYMDWALLFSIVVMLTEEVFGIVMEFLVASFDAVFSNFLLAHTYTDHPVAYGYCSFEALRHSLVCLWIEIQLCGLGLSSCQQKDCPLSNQIVNIPWIRMRKLGYSLWLGR